MCKEPREYFIEDAELQTRQKAPRRINTHIKPKNYLTHVHTSARTVLITLATKIQWNQLRLREPGKSGLGFNLFLPQSEENKAWLLPLMNE